MIKTHFLKAYLLFFMLICISVLATAQRKPKQTQEDKDTQSWRYELKTAEEIGMQGTYLLKVYTFSKSPNIATEQSKKNAIHGVIFRGFQGDGRLPGQKPLCPDPNAEIAHADYFKDFFAEGGKYMKFVRFTNDGAVPQTDVLKRGNEYQIGLTVAVDITGLRKELESAGIIKSLSSGF